MSTPKLQSTENWIFLCIVTTIGLITLSIGTMQLDGITAGIGAGLLSITCLLTCIRKFEKRIQNAKTLALEDPQGFRKIVRESIITIVLLTLGVIGFRYLIALQESSPEISKIIANGTIIVTIILAVAGLCYAKWITTYKKIR